jgi:osmotically inducible protein OsmC
MKRTATARWSGTLKDGSGTLSAPGLVLNKTPYSFKTRFEEDPGTNPEELIAAAHAGCFSMALSHALSNAGFKPESIETNATVNFDNVDGSWTITNIHLDVRAKVPGLDEAKFQPLATSAKLNCPVSKALKPDITMKATLSR